MKGSQSIERMKAGVKYELLNALEFPNLHFIEKSRIPPQMSMVNTLVMQYLEWVGFKYTIPVFRTESADQYKPQAKNQKLKELFKFDDYPRNVPFLVHMVVQQTKKYKALKLAEQRRPRSQSFHHHQSSAQSNE